MYNLHLTVRETVGAYVCTMALSDTDEWGKTTPVASKEMLVEAPDPDEDPLEQLLEATARWVSVLSR